MERGEFERLIKLEQKQTDSITHLDKHIEDDRRVLTGMTDSINDIYQKLSELESSHAELRTAMKIIGTSIVVMTPVITALVVTLIEFFILRR